MKQVVGLVGGFFAGAAAVGVATAAVSVYLLERFDPKFRGAPGAAFELEAASGAVMAFLGVLILAIAAGIWRTLRPAGILNLRHPAGYGLAAGALFALGFWLIGLSGGALAERTATLYAIALWGFLLCYPAAVVWLAVRRSRAA